MYFGHATLYVHVEYTGTFYYLKQYQTCLYIMNVVVFSYFKILNMTNRHITTTELLSSPISFICYDMALAKNNSGFDDMQPLILYKTKLGSH